MDTRKLTTEGHSPGGAPFAIDSAVAALALDQLPHAVVLVRIPGGEVEYANQEAWTSSAGLDDGFDWETLLGRQAAQRLSDCLHSDRADQFEATIGGLAVKCRVTRLSASQSMVSWHPAAGSTVQVDPLTRLPTREGLTARLADLRSRGQSCGLLFADVDRFKQINDRFGHAVGDRVLQAVARRIADSLRRDDLVVRLGGDEFVAVVEGLVEQAEATRIAERLQAALRAPLRIGSRQIPTSASVGAVFAARNLPLETLLAQADQAMYRAKRQGKHRGAFNIRRAS